MHLSVQPLLLALCVASAFTNVLAYAIDKAGRLLDPKGDAMRTRGGLILVLIM